ncbi:hypothetical protein BDV96DRAFT_582434 [Lophiotrema nucula]|uniref:Microbial-type PARG catalytic domain-containing protein n=1 Tax=Lophiotrema nucula TaxID=690887 RepID=A0A6A5YWI3_9PLEO|nr:hypothetical protein BDV96DRAFT_582434 [Lophiotrema nucula]
MREGSGKMGGEDVGVEYVKRKGQGRRKVKGGGDEMGVREGKGKGKRRKDSIDVHFDDLSISPTAQESRPRDNLKIRIVATDTLTAAHMLTFPSNYGEVGSTLRSNKKQPNTLILNMASPLRPGGGVLTGATSQEEFLCARTTLLPSLKESFYRLPELGGVYTHDVMVFRNHLPLGDSKGELGLGERFWIDVVSAGMLCFPDLEGEEDEEKRLSKADMQFVEQKMRAVMRIACMKGAKKIVLGAWGAGAYGNPVRDVAEAWRRVLLPEITAGAPKKGKATVEVENWETVEDIIFAISNRGMAEEFGRAFGGIVIESGPGEVDNEEDEEDEVAEELRSKIEEMESQIPKVWNADLKSKLIATVDILRGQLKDRERAVGVDGDDEDEDKDNSIVSEKAEVSDGSEDEDTEDIEIEESEEDGTDGTDDEGGEEASEISQKEGGWNVSRRC